jgi:murein endopeptidase
VDKTPAQLEAEGVETIDVEWEGMTLPVPADAQGWDLDALEAFENGKAIGLIRALFTSETYEQMKVTFRRNHGRPPKLKDLDGLMEAIAKSAGFESPGE